MRRLILVATVAALSLFVGPALASPAKRIRTFLDDSCLPCHDKATRSGNLDLESLRLDPGDGDDLRRWALVHDRARAGEMPPSDWPRPDADELAAFVDSLARALTEAEQARSVAHGRATLRRLNRYEYENIIRDLLHVPWVEIKDRLPDDGVASRFNKSSRALDISHVHMSRYMSSADYAMREAMRAVLDRPATATVRYYARDEGSLVGSFRPRENSTLPDRHSFPVLDARAQPDVRWGRAPLSSPDTREREAVGRVSSIFSDAGGYSWGQFRATVAGRYRLRFKGYTIWVSGGGISRWYYEGFGEEKAPVYYLPLWHRPNVDEVWPGRTSEPMSVFAQSTGQNRRIGEFAFDPEPSIGEVTATLRAGEVVRTDGSRLFRTRVNGTGEQYVNPLATDHGMPGYAIQWMEVEGPLPDEHEDAGYQLLFRDLPMVKVASGAGVPLEVVPPPRRDGGGAPGAPGDGVGSGAPANALVEVASRDPERDAERLLRNFIEHAYRRPVTDADVAPFFALFKEQYAREFGFARSLLSAYTAVLTSPGFLFVEESPGKLDDHALAMRLSLFLWNSAPDERLRELARQGTISDPDVLRGEADRLLDDPKSRRFVEAFTDYWLDLRKIDETTPSQTLYNDYELNDPLKLAAIEETRLFMAELLRENLPARSIVDSRFTFLNETLARHYGIDGVKGVAMRKVALDEASVRGGLMTQASVLKVTANGTTTSPILRGVWITERILGFETPPPPPVPTVEPDIRGAVTIRQQLEAHRRDPSCAVCHDRSDPPGLALESFDIMGAWRDRYRAVNDEVAAEPGIGMDGQAFKFHYALGVDPSGKMMDGRTFQNVHDLKQLLLEDELQIARNLARQLTVYATGAPIGFSDRAVIEEILSRTRSRGYPVRSIVHEIVQSRLFQNK
jgi:hypothetical protein